MLGPWGRQANKKEIEDILVKVKFDLPYLNVFKLVKLGSMVDDSVENITIFRQYIAKISVSVGVEMIYTMDISVVKGLVNAVKAQN